MQNFRVLFYSFLFIICGNLQAEISTYQSSDNSGQNKFERIEVIEKYLIDLSSTLKKMESKLDENSKKIKTFDEQIKSLKDKDQKIGNKELGESKIPNPKDMSEVDKLKNDFLSLKNNDVEKLKKEFQELSDTVKAIQSTLKTQ